jgi:uncharacterized protein
MGDVIPIQQRFDNALASFIAKAERDPYILAIVLFGSMAHDRVWEKSDVDLLLVGRDETARGGNKADQSRGFNLVEDGINFHATIMPRAKFRKLVEGSLGSSFWHSSFSLSKLVFTRDESLRELYDGVHRLGAHDRQIQLLRAATSVLPALLKAEKWYHVRQDYDYAALWILKLVEGLAQIEVFLEGQIARREVLQQAMELNPALFKSVYTDLLSSKKTAKNVGAVLTIVDDYLTRKIKTLFGPILDYLAESGSPRSATEIDHYFKNQMDISWAVMACEWLAQKDIIAQVSTPVRLTEKSKIEFDESAFYYERDAVNAETPRRKEG